MLGEVYRKESFEDFSNWDGGNRAEGSVAGASSLRLWWMCVFVVVIYSDFHLKIIMVGDSGNLVDEKNN